MKKKNLIQHLLVATIIIVLIIMAIFFCHKQLAAKSESTKTAVVNANAGGTTGNTEEASGQVGNDSDLIPNSTNSSSDDSNSEEPVDTTINLIMVGDVLMHTKVVDKGLQQDDSYNFDFLFEHVKDRIEDADLAIANQETILGGTELGVSGYPCFNSPTEVGDAEAKAGFDLILHGTNHALDVGKKGLMNCMDFWEQQHPEVAYLGINKNQEAKDNDIFYFEQNGIKIAVLNYTFSTNGISVPADMPYAVNYLEEEKVIKDLKVAEDTADFVIVCPHWGTEYELEISAEQDYWANLFLENGVDLVLGTHPHVIEPIEWVSDTTGNKMLVYYSLGNYVNGTSSTGSGVSNRMVGGMADVTIGKNESGEAYIEEYGVIPLVCHWCDEEITTYYLSDYTEQMAEENQILDQDAEFSLDYCKNLVNQVWEKNVIEIR